MNRYNFEFKSNLGLLSILLITGPLLIGILTEMPSKQVFGQSDDLNTNSSDVNKGSNIDFILNNSLTSNLVFTANSNLSSNVSASSSSSAGVSSATNEVKGDFNGDGFEDLAIGVPAEDVDTSTGTILDAGAVNVIYGSANGLSITALRPDQFWTQDTSDVEDHAEESDLFGYSLSAGDFNGDGKDDLAIGAIEDVITESGILVDAGAVNVIYGSANGLSTTSPIADQLLIQGIAGVDDRANEWDVFGSTLG